MHEASIAYEIFRIAVEEGKRRGYRKIDRIGLRVGELANIETDTLLFAFSAISEMSIAEGAELDVERVCAVIECGCGSEFLFKGNGYRCPECGGVGSLKQGMEMEVCGIEGG